MPRRLSSLARDYLSLDRRAFWLALVRTINTAGLSLVMVFMGIYMVSSRGLTLTEYGVIVLVTSAVQSWAQGYAGIVSDRHGRRPVMMTALATRAVVIILLGWLVSLDANVLVLTAVLAVSSALRGAFEPVAYAFVADLVEPKQRVTAYGLQRLGTNLGWAAGPAAGGALLGSLDYGVVFYCASPFLLLSAIIVWRLREPPRRAAVGARISVFGALAAAAKSRRGALFLLGVFLASVCHLQLFTTLSVYAERTLGISELAIGSLYSVNAAVVLALQVPAVILINRFGARAALIVGGVLFVAAFALFSQATAFGGAAIAVVVLTLGEILLAPAQQALVAEQSDKDTYGQAFGVIGTVTMLGVAVGPILGGVAFDVLGATGAMWLVLAVLPALTTLAFGWFAAVSKAPAEAA